MIKIKLIKINFIFKDKDKGKDKMAVQYPKQEHLTLGSVEGWGTDMNILRDPPKSITTRRIDRVGDTSDITQTIDVSSDRVTDSINLYARGVNPMVSVSYGNYGTNGGRVGDITQTSGRAQPRLPYPIMEGGAFRPPVRGPRDLLPLSRLPRAMIADVASGVNKPDYSKTSQYLGELRAVKDLLNAYDIQPNKVGSISKNLIENFKMDNAINDKHINIDVSSGVRSRDITSFTRDHVDVYKGASEDALSAFASSNLSRSDGAQTLENFELTPSKYIQDSLNYEAYTNLSRNQPQGLDNINLDTSKTVQDALNYEAMTNLSRNRLQGLENIHLDTSKTVQDALNYEAVTNLSSNINVKTLDELNDKGRRVTVKDNIIQYERNAGIKSNVTFLNDIAQHNPTLEMRGPQFSVEAQRSDARVHRRVDHQNEISFKQSRPMASVKANITKIEDFNSINLSSREAHLPPTLQKGGFSNSGVKPTTSRADVVAPREHDKDRIRNKVNEQQFSRFSY